MSTDFSPPQHQSSPPERTNGAGFSSERYADERQALAAFAYGLDTMKCSDRSEEIFGRYLTQAEVHNILGRAQELRFKGEIA